MTRQQLNTLSALFGWSFVICATLQLIAFGMLIAGHDLAYDMHSSFFNITAETFDIVSYTMLGAMKTLGLTLFLCPWAATKIVAARMSE